MPKTCATCVLTYGHAGTDIRSFVFWWVAGPFLPNPQSNSGPPPPGIWYPRCRGVCPGGIGLPLPNHTLPTSRKSFPVRPRHSKSPSMETAKKRFQMNKETAIRLGGVRSSKTVCGCP